MVLRHEPDVSHATWFTQGHDDWGQLCTIGPSGFPAYARVLHPCDDPDDDQELGNVEGDLPAEQLQALCAVLARHTTTPDDCFFGLWEGYGEIHGGGRTLIGSRFRWRRTRRREHPALGPKVLEAPKVVIPQRDYLLFRGTLPDAGRWPTRNGSRINSPGLAWPSDHAWLFATDIDAAWTGVGGSVALGEELLAHDLLDTVPAVASPDQPRYRD